MTMVKPRNLCTLSLWDIASIVSSVFDRLFCTVPLAVLYWWPECSWMFSFYFYSAHFPVHWIVSIRPRSSEEWNGNNWEWSKRNGARSTVLDILCFDWSALYSCDCLFSYVPSVVFLVFCCSFNQQKIPSLQVCTRLLLNCQVFFSLSTAVC